MSVLFIGHDASRTGAPLLLLHFFKWLRRETSVKFELLLRDGGELIQDYRDVAPTRIVNGEIFPHVSSSLGNRISRHFPGLLTRRLRRFYPLKDFPIVYSNTVTNGLLIREFFNLHRTIICHAHEMRFVIEGCAGGEALKTVEMISCFIAASQAVKNDLRDVMKVPSEKIRLIHEFGLPVSLTLDQRQESRERIRAELGIPETDIVVGMCGTMDWRKGADLFPLLAKAVVRLDSARRYSFLWIGATRDSPENQQMVHDIRNLGLNDTIKISYKVTNPHDYLSALDVFALTSREDPFPVAMLDAASLGLPVLCFANSGGGSEFVEHDAGLVVPYLDIESMAKAAVSLGVDSNMRRVMGQKARTKMNSRFSLASQGPQLVEVVNSCLQEVERDETRLVKRKMAIIQISA